MDALEKMTADQLCIKIILHFLNAITSTILFFYIRVASRYSKFKDPSNYKLYDLVQKMLQISYMGYFLKESRKILLFSLSLNLPITFYFYQNMGNDFCCNMKYKNSPSLVLCPQKIIRYNLIQNISL